MKFGEEFSILEEGEGEDNNNNDTTMSEPLLPSSSPSSACTENNNTGAQVRHRNRNRPTAASSVRFVVDNDDDDDDVEHQNQNQNQHQFQSEQRILDRSGTLRQSRGRWGVERRLSRALREERIRGGICCCRKIYQDCGKDWFFWLVYQKTFVLFLLLFFSYSLIVCFFGFVYLVRILDIRQIHDTCSISGCMTCNSD
ncbi:MAG: hypothetical protein ACI8RD_012015 [Bacillariaceae sp.]|jgi:hypothetical protein